MNTCLRLVSKCLEWMHKQFAEFCNLQNEKESVWSRYGGHSWYCCQRTSWQNCLMTWLTQLSPSWHWRQSPYHGADVHLNKLLINILFSFVRETHSRKPQHTKERRRGWGKEWGKEGEILSRLRLKEERRWQHFLTCLSARWCFWWRQE